ncbi:YaeQ family protein [Bdellovibrio bacteriovorus]|nr:YaeQ family protein [Bdellovibrio bacteriovorus]BEV67835.1 putative protein YaeQ [Bdellovibrio bacteriovorus]
MLRPMAQPSKLYRFRIDLSDIDRGIYEQLDFRLAMHPSESMPYMLTRALAYACNYSQDLQFSAQGLGDPESAALSHSDATSGRTLLWIEIGNPSPKKLHKASKASQAVKIYTYKDASQILRDCEKENVHQPEKIEIYQLDDKFLTTLGEESSREFRFSLMVQEGSLTITRGEEILNSEFTRFYLKDPA